jgi:multisubunit Na+/H+ antiporter MnhF subunit
MIDTWFFAALCLMVIAAGALVRVVRIPARYDRIVAATAGITIAGAAGITLAISQGNILILDVTIILALVGYAAIIASCNRAGEVSA